MKSTLDNYMNELDAFLTEASTVKFNNKETLRGQGFDRKVKEDGTESGSELGGEFSFTPEAKPKQESPQQEVSPDDNQGQVQAGENQETNKVPNNNGQNDVKDEGASAPETAPEAPQPNANNGLKKKYMKMLKVVTTIQKEVNQLEKASGKTIDELAEIASQSSQQSSEQQQ